MLNNRNLILLALPLLCALSCAQKEETMLEMPSAVQSAKIANTPYNASDESVLFRIEKGGEGALTAELAGLGFASVDRVFPDIPGKEEKAAAFGLDRWYKAVLSEGSDITAAANALAQVEAIEVVEYNTELVKASDGVSYPYQVPAVLTKASGNAFNDPMLQDQWHYINTGDVSIAASINRNADINVKDVWSLTAGDPSIIVAVVDEGVKHSHPDLAANMWVNQKELDGKEGVDDDGNGYIDDIHGLNFVTEGPITWHKVDDSGHGTHIAGTIAAVNNNGIGVSGVAGGTGNGDGVRIMGCQIHDGGTAGTADVSAKAIRYAADNGASIIQCSWGYLPGFFMSDGAYDRAFPMELAAIKYFEATKNNPVLDGGIAVFASGNDGLNYSSYPGAYNDFICVSAFGPDFLPTYYTNYGPGCNIIAPGGEGCLPPWTSQKGLVLSTLCSETSEGGTDYGYMQGTSMACPHVSGVVALGLSYAKKLGKTFSTAEFKDMVVSSANEFDSRLNGTKTYAPGTLQDLDLSKFRKQMGSGSIDAWRLMMKIEGVPCLVAETGRNQWLDVSDYFGTSSVNLTYLSVEVTEAGRESLGLAEDPYMEYGKLYVHPTKPGSAKIVIKAVAGGDHVGNDSEIGGMEVTQEISVIARSFKSSNGGWL